MYPCQPPNENILACRAWKKKRKLHPSPVSVCLNLPDHFFPTVQLVPFVNGWFLHCWLKKQAWKRLAVCSFSELWSLPSLCRLQSNSDEEIDLIMQTAAGLVIRPQSRDKWTLFIKSYSDQLISPRKQGPDVSERTLEISCNQGDLSLFSPWRCLLF